MGFNSSISEINFEASSRLPSITKILAMLVIASMFELSSTSRLFQLFLISVLFCLNLVLDLAINFRAIMFFSFVSSILEQISIQPSKSPIMYLERTQWFISFSERVISFSEHSLSTDFQSSFFTEFLISKLRICSEVGIVPPV